MFSKTFYIRLLALLWLCLLLNACGTHKEPFQNQDISGVDYGRTFTLTDHTGKTRRLTDYRGKVVVMFFGYTQCPDVCPTTLANMAEVMTLLGENAKRVQVLFVTVDPERDTPQLLSNYVPQFHPSFVGLYGDAFATQAVAKEFRIFFQKQPGRSATTYSVDHSTGSYILDPQGKLRLYVKHPEAAQKIAADIRRLLAGE